MRAVSTREFLYIRNYETDRWPSGDPLLLADIDNGPAKEFVVSHKDRKFYELACGERPAEQLYDLKLDSAQQVNVATEPKYAGSRAKLAKMLDEGLKKGQDPRATGQKIIWDSRPYYGGANPLSRK